MMPISATPIPGQYRRGGGRRSTRPSSRPTHTGVVHTSTVERITVVRCKELNHA